MEEKRNFTLLTDFYELTMMQGYFKEKDANETVIFDMFYRTGQPVGIGAAAPRHTGHARRHPRCIAAQHRDLLLQHTLQLSAVW